MPDLQETLLIDGRLRSANEKDAFWRPARNLVARIKLSYFRHGF